MGKYEIKGEGRRIAALLCSIILIQVAFYYFLANIVNGAGALAVPQPDTLLYCQAARRIVEGHAFSFSSGTSVSTGTTSVLYPFVLSVPYWLGAHGRSLLHAGFLLNFVFYLLFVFGWSKAISVWLPEKCKKFALLLLVLCPQPLYCAMSQSDIGLWLAVSGLTFGAIATRNVLAMSVLLIVSPWVRPEGALVIVALGFVALLRRDWKLLTISAVSALSVAGVMLLNRHLTGLSGFSSTASKGYFVDSPFLLAIHRSIESAYFMVKELVFGQAVTYPRCWYAIPIFGAVAIWIGAFRFDWRRHWQSMAVVVLAAFGCLLVVAQSGWQGTNHDRYLAWLVPLLTIFGAIGWHEASTWFGNRGVRLAFLAAPIAYSAVACVSMAVCYGRACENTDQMAKFALEMDRSLPTASSVGTAGWCGTAYFLGDRKLVHLSGIYSPEVNAEHPTGVLEILKHDKTSRFDYWLREPRALFPDEVSGLMGETFLPGPGGFSLKKVDWRFCDVAAENPVVSNKVLKCRVDIAYEKDEKASEYEVVTCYGMPPYEPIFVVGELNGVKAVDCGRVIVGRDEFFASNLEPGKDVTVALRLGDKAHAVGHDMFGGVYETDCEFSGEQSIDVEVDGNHAAHAHYHMKDSGFTHVNLRVPGRLITAARHRFSFGGDRVVTGYWFYQ